MDRTTGRPNHFEDYLITVHDDAWFTYTDSKNKIYANLRLAEKMWNSDATELVANPYSLPTEQQCIDGLKALQEAFDAKSVGWTRQPLYPSLGDFADAMYWNSKGDSSKLTAYYEACEKVKSDNPKPS